MKSDPTDPLEPDPLEPDALEPEQGTINSVDAGPQPSSRLKSNPLATRFVEPGRVAWRVAPSQPSLEQLADYFTSKLNWRAAIVGPHGSGKSTLLEHLVPRLGDILLKRAAYEPGPVAKTDDAGSDKKRRSIVWLKLRGKRDSHQLLVDTRPQWHRPESLLVIDGYEQLSRLVRIQLLLSTWRARTGLLVTSHRKTLLPTLTETRVDAALASELLDHLLPSDLVNREQLLDNHRLHALLVQHHGNLREVFMQLYDEVERR